MSTVLPWDLTPALAQDRLVTLARVAVATRNKAFSEADRAAGDTNWGLACKAHERLMFALDKLAGRPAGRDTGAPPHPWLTVVREGLYVMPLIEDVPIRLYRGAPDRPGSRHLDAVRFEFERARAERPQLAFEFVATPADGPWYWLMAMETDAAGMVSRVFFIQANDAGETRHPWECPLEERREEQIPAPVVKLVDAHAPAAGKRGRRGAKLDVANAPNARGAADTRQEELWGTALGAE